MHGLKKFPDPVEKLEPINEAALFGSPPLPCLQNLCCSHPFIAYLSSTSTQREVRFNSENIKMFYYSLSVVVLLFLTLSNRSASVPLSSKRSSIFIGQSTVDTISGDMAGTAQVAGLQLYSEPDCTGEMRWFTSDFDKLETSFNDQASCAIVHSSDSWIVYEHFNYHGKSIFFMGAVNASSPATHENIRNLGIDNKISAARRISSSGVYLFDGSHLSGTYARFAPSQNQPFLERFNDRTVSLIVFDECIQVFEHSGYTGMSKKVRRGVYMNIAKHGFSDGILSSFKACDM